MKSVDQVTIINRWYDRRMFTPPGSRPYNRSDFHNWGYWKPDTRTLKEASENLMEELLAFIPHKTGTMLDVACGKGATTSCLLKYYRPEDVTGVNISEKQLISESLSKVAGREAVSFGVCPESGLKESASFLLVYSNY